jgi:hypothetical protein
LPDGTHQQVINKVTEWLAENGELDHSDPAKIDFKRIGIKVGRGKAKPNNSPNSLIHFAQIRTQCPTDTGSPIAYASA